MRYLVTGAAGFIGSALTNRLLSEGHEVVGLDNLNNYYHPSLKMARLANLGITQNEIPYGQKVDNGIGFQFYRIDLSDREQVERVFADYHFDGVVNLAAQAGVRYSLENPHTYINSNVVGFLHILEGCRQRHISRLVYASSSSVYGGNDRVPFRETDRVDSPVSLYAATKRSNELMAHVYSHLYGLKTTGLRFFTVYGPWGRPDMAFCLFADAMLHHRPLRLFNNGEMQRDFTFIDDIVEGTLRILLADESPQPVYNIGYGSSQPLTLMLHHLEEALGCQALIDYAPMQPGDVSRTWADTTALQRDFGYKPKVSLAEGIQHFAEWYKTYADKF